MRVMKFGGAALRDGPSIERSMRIVERTTSQGRVLVVVSAAEGVTALLRRAAEAAVGGELEPWDALRVRHRTLLAQLGLASDLLDRHLLELKAILGELRTLARSDRRMTDYVLSFGERMSARVAAAVLRAAGTDAAPLDAYDLGLTTASRQGENALLGPPDESVRRRLAAVPGVPVVTGFLALDSAGHLTTLGPNGSDLSAVWFGEAVRADEVVLWKAVEGFLTADPDLVPEARRIPTLGRDEAIEFAIHGADVIHAGALEPAARGRIRVRVADVAHPDAPGSLIEDTTPRSGPLGIAHRDAVALYREKLSLGRDQDAQMAELLAELIAAELQPAHAEFTGREGRALLADLDRAAALTARRGPSATLERGLSAFTIIGRELNPSELDERLRALWPTARPLESASPSRTYLVARVELTPCVQAVHAELFPEAVVEPRRPPTLAPGTATPTQARASSRP